MTTTDPRLCPEAAERDAMDEGEFWERVARNLGVNVGEPDVAQACDPQVLIEPCGVCGSDGACGYDTEGRALIHATDVERDNDAAEGWPT